MTDREKLPFNIYLIGFMGCGKSTIAAALRKNYGMPVAEMDQMIVEEEGMSIPEIFSSKGEAHFRTVETNLLKRLAETSNHVVSCGGGAATRRENVELMKKGGVVVLLTATPEEIYKRVRYSTNRPLLKGRMSVEGIKELMDARRPAYEAAADITILTDGKDANRICREIMDAVKDKMYNRFTEEPEI
ncbi:MAG: shikimate kinase [Eubacterium sp.]|nr:shikimate kinase [Eubacterium sp.]